MTSRFSGRVSRSGHVRFGRLAVALVATGLVVGLASILPAQTFRGAIEGTVMDQTQAFVSGAKVTVKNQETGVARVTQTNDDGQYNVPELPIGTYTVTVESAGFTIWTAGCVVVDVGSAKRVDATLRPGAVTQEITVSAQDLPQVETTNDTLGSTLTANTVKELPLNGRDYTKLIYLSLCRSQIETGAEPSYGDQPLPKGMILGFRARKSDWRPNVGVGIEQVKASRQNACHSARRAVYHPALAEHAWIAGATMLPESITEHDGGIGL